MNIDGPQADLRSGPPNGILQFTPGMHTMWILHEVLQ
jgi:hypothetical protein